LFGGAADRGTFVVSPLRKHRSILEASYRCDAS
jgi:hypothetical protein